MGVCCETVLLAMRRLLHRRNYNGYDYVHKMYKRTNHAGKNLPMNLEGAHELLLLVEQLLAVDSW